MKFEGNWKMCQASGLEDLFLKECVKLCSDEEEFAVFKRNSIFTKIIGNDIRKKQISDVWYDFVKDTNLIDYLKKFKTNDIFGYPITYMYPKTGLISPGTLCFMSVLHDINTRLIDVKGKVVCEIGSGYGGQSKIFLDYGASEVQLIDRTETLSLARKYLSKFSYNRLRYSTINEIPEQEYDLVVSNWCLSELDRQGTKFYLDNVISNSQNGYFLVNYRNSKDRDWLLSELKNVFSNVTIEEEVPKTNENVNHVITCSK